MIVIDQETILHANFLSIHEKQIFVHPTHLCILWKNQTQRLFFNKYFYHLILMALI